MPTLHNADLPQHEDDVTAYAERLAAALAKKHYPEVTNWKPMTGDLLSLLTQIDNMTAGLEKRDHAAPEMTLVEEGYHAFYTVLERNGGPGDAIQHCPYTINASDEHRQWMAGWGSAEDRWLDEK